MEEKEDQQYKRFTVSVDKEIYDKFEEYRNASGSKQSRSDLIRKAMQAYMIKEKDKMEHDGHIVGCIVFTLGHEHFDPKHQHAHAHDEKHDHHHDDDHEHPHEHNLDSTHEHDYSSQPIYASVQQTDLLLINDIQHHFSDIILSATHYHLAFEKCMEIITVSGSYQRFKKLKSYLQRLKSIKFIEEIIID